MTSIARECFQLVSRKGDACGLQLLGSFWCVQRFREGLPDELKGRCEDLEGVLGRCQHAVELALTAQPGVAASTFAQRAQRPLIKGKPSN